MFLRLIFCYSVISFTNFLSVLFVQSHIKYIIDIRLCSVALHNCSKCGGWWLFLWEIYWHTTTVHLCRTAAHHIGAEHGQLPGVREAITSSDARDWNSAGKAAHIWKPFQGQQGNQTYSVAWMHRIIASASDIQNIIVLHVKSIDDWKPLFVSRLKTSCSCAHYVQCCLFCDHA